MTDHANQQSLEKIMADANAQKNHADKAEHKSGEHKEPEGSILNPFYVASGAISLAANTARSVLQAFYSIGSGISSMFDYSPSHKEEKHEPKESPAHP